MVEESQNMMGMLGNNNPLFDNLLKTAKKEMTEANPPNNNNNNNSTSSNPTRDRLKKKLEQRKNNK